MGSLLGNIRLTFAIAAMAVCSIAIAIAAVLLGLFISLSGTARSDAEHEVASATRITAEILQVNLPSLEIASDEAGNVAALTMRSMPRFRTHGVIDTIARVAGQNAAIYVYDPRSAPTSGSARPACSAPTANACSIRPSPPARRFTMP